MVMRRDLRFVTQRSAVSALTSALLSALLIAGAWDALMTSAPLAQERATTPAAASAGAAIASSTQTRVGALPDEPLRDVPREVVLSYLEACRAGDYRHAAGFLDLRHVPALQRVAEGPVLAEQLKTVLDQKLWIDLDVLSDAPAGELDDGLPDDFERVGTIATSRGSVDILLQRVFDPDETPRWRFSLSTVTRIPFLYGEFGNGPIEKLLPAPLVRIRFLEMRLWQWLGLLVLIFVAMGVAWIAQSIVYAVLRPLVRRTQITFDDRLLEMMVGPLRVGAWVAAFSIGTLFVGLSVPVHTALRAVQAGITVIAVTWIAIRLVDLCSAMLEAQLQAQGKTAAVSVLPLGRRTVKVALGTLAFIGLLQNLGVQVTGLVASLGVGGLAVALAAQKTFENFFGGIAVIMDQPVRVGDACRIGSVEGTVEDIGLRSTRIRTLDRTVVAIPNGEFASMQIENLGRRDQFRLLLRVGLRCETTPDQLRYVLVELKKLLVAHPRVVTDSSRVRFVGLGISSLDVELLGFVRTKDLHEFSAVREDVLLRVMEVLQSSGTGIAVPAQTLYLGRDRGTDPQRTSLAEQQVDALRQQGALPIPEMPAATVSEMDGTLDYPPRGSASARGARTG
jgi:MscS family membrane protein